MTVYDFQPIPQRENHRLLAEWAYQTLRKKIVDCELLPGSTIVETDLATSLGISRTPIRESLRRLEEDGLVRLLSHRGAYVTEVSLKYIEEVSQLREVVEGMAARLAAEKLTEAGAAEIDQLLRRCASLSADSSLQEIFSLDNECHAWILRLSGNELAGRMLSKLYGHMHRIRSISATVRTRLPQSFLEHQQILHAIREREPHLAEQLMRHHIRKTQQNAAAQFQGQRLSLEFPGSGSNDGNPMRVTLTKEV